MEPGKRASMLPEPVEVLAVKHGIRSSLAREITCSKLSLSTERVSETDRWALERAVSASRGRERGGPRNAKPHPSMLEYSAEVQRGARVRVSEREVGDQNPQGISGAEKELHRLILLGERMQREHCRTR